MADSVAPPQPPAAAVAAASNASATMSLGELFDAARAGFQAVEDGEVRGGTPEFEETLKALQECGKRVKSEGVFSSNEEADDVKSESLRYLLIDYFVGRCYGRVMGDERAKHLKRGAAHLAVFLNKLERIPGLMTEGNKAQYQLQQRGKAEGGGQDPNTYRMAKIARFKREKEVRERRQQLEVLRRVQSKDESGVTEEVVRELAMLELEAAATEALLSLSMTGRELQMLEHRAMLMAQNGGVGAAEREAERRRAMRTSGSGPAAAAGRGGGGR